jgi:peroxiredoxin Q/BCP
MTIKFTDFSLATTSGKTLSLSDLKGQFSIVYFYPKDSTPGCTLEGQDFRDHFEAFKALGAEIYGVSRDSVKSHENFKCKQSFPFDLISDPDETLCKLFDVIKLKNMYGKEVLGIERSTFIINPKGEIAAEWRKVSVKGHVLEVLEKLKTLAA